MDPQVLAQQDFGAGIYRGHEAPPNAVYDAVNALIDDEGQLFRRGGTAYLTVSDAGNALTGLAIARLVGGDRIVAWDGTDLWVYSGGGMVKVLDGSVANPLAMRPLSRAAIIDQQMFIPSWTENFVKYAGSFKPGTTSSFTGSGTTLTGTSLLTVMDAGMVGAGDNGYQVVNSVESNTSATLRYEAVGTAVTQAYKAVTLRDNASLVIDVPGSGVFHLTEAATRLIAARGSRVGFTEPSDSSNGAAFYQADQYHQLSGDSTITGVQGIGTTCLVFTTNGVWAISNLDLDPIDDLGNVQHQVQRVNGDVVLWDDPGLASWAGAVLVPALDDVYLFSLDQAPQPISEGIRPLYRSYVQSGYTVGQAAIYRGHYILPIVNGTTLVDVLVCRLDRGFAWTRWSGHAACIAYSVYVQSNATASPRLFGISGQRIIELTKCFTPDATNPTDINSTTHVMTVDTVDQQLGDSPRPGTALKVRATYEMTQQGGTATVGMSVARGPVSASFTALANLTGGVTSDGLTASAWRVNLKAPALRYRFQSSGPVSGLTLRSLETVYRPTGRL